jgi:hypothetical protein
MTRHRSRSILLRLSLTFIAALFVAPCGAWAGSLLSGYGGPGGGTQALLGSTLIGSHSSGGGSSGGGTSGSSSTPSATQASSEGSTASGQSSGAGAGKGTEGTASGGASGAQRNGAHGTETFGTSAGGSAAYTTTGGRRPGAGFGAASDSSPLGLTGIDVLLLVFVLGVLAITMGLTTRLARMQDSS